MWGVWWWGGVSKKKCCTNDGSTIWLGFVLQILERVERKRSKMNMVSRMDRPKAREAGERARTVEAVRQQEMENRAETERDRDRRRRRENKRKCLSRKE